MILTPSLTYSITLYIQRSSPRPNNQRTVANVKLLNLKFQFDAYNSGLGELQFTVGYFSLLKIQKVMLPTEGAFSSSKFHTLKETILAKIQVNIKSQLNMQ